MEISINNTDQQDEERNRRKNSKERRKMSPTLRLILQVLVCCAIIDVPLWAYFHFVKGVSFWEGMKQTRDAIQGRDTEKKEPIKFASGHDEPIRKPS